MSFIQKLSSIETDKNRFHAMAKMFLYHRKADNGCIEWDGPSNDHGYGVYNLGANYRQGVTEWLGKKSTIYVHRLAWILANGEIPKGQVVCHKCDNPKCFNIEHLFLGTPEENFDDMRKKKRHAFGERNGHAKMNRQTVKEMRQMRREGAPIQELSVRFGVSEGCVSTICSGKTWGNF